MSLTPNKKAFGEGTQSWGFAVRLPKTVVDALSIKFPQFNAKDPDVRQMAWKVFFETEIGRFYMNQSGQRTGSQLKRANDNKIIVK